MLNRIPSPLRAAATAVFLLLTAAFVASSASAQGAGYWHTSGSKIVDSNGTEVRVAGINWYGFETPDYLVHGLWAADYKTVLNNIKSLGFNVIRIPFSNQMVESDPVPTNYTNNASGTTVNQALVGATALQDLDTIVSYAGSIGLRVILDNHRSDAGESNEAIGLWYTSAYPQSNWIADWQTMATRYSASKFTFNGNPTVIGMDLRNEPHLIGTSSTSGSCWTGDTTVGGCPTSMTSQNWPVAATAAGNAILSINPHLLIFVEGNDCYDGTCGWQGGNLIGVATNPVKLSVANQLAYSAHDYGPNLYQQSWFNGSTTPASLDATWNKYWGYISAQGIAPVWLGEFGTDNSASDVESSTPGSQGQWFESLVSYLQSNPQLNWTYWALNGEDSYGLLDANYDSTPPSTLKLSELESVQFPLSGGGSTNPSFTLSSSPTSVAVTQGSSATDTISVSDAGGFTGAVTLSASGLPSGVTAAFGTNPTTGSSAVTFTASSSATPGAYTVTINGASGSTTASTTLSLSVAAQSTGSFSLKASSSALSVAQGASGTDSVAVSDVSPFSGSVSFAASGAPSGVTVSFSPTSSASATTASFAVGSSVAAGSYPITITGTSGSLTASTSVTLTVTAQSTGSFSLKASSSALSVAQGASGTDTITVNDMSPFSGIVSFAASGAPSGVTVSFSPTASASSTMASFAVGSSVAAGSYPITITGTSGSLTASTSVTLTVTAQSAGSFSLKASSSALSVAQGASGTDSVAVSDVSPFSGSVSFAASGAPSGVTVSFSPASSASGTTASFAVGSSVAAGSYPITITGTSGSLTASTSVTLTVTSTTTSGFGCHVVYTVNSQWPSGFGAAITLENTGTTNWSNWTLTWTYANGQTITSLWNGTESQSGGNVTVSSLSYNGSIAAGGSYNGMGFNGSWNNSTNSVPTSFAVNGNTCH